MLLPEGSTGNPGVDSVVFWCSSAVIVTSALALVWRMSRGLRRFLHRAELFWDDWEGVPERPGVPGREGMMERVSGVESRMGRLEERLRGVEASVSKVWHGGSAE